MTITKKQKFSSFIRRALEFFISILFSEIIGSTLAWAEDGSQFKNTNMDLISAEARVKRLAIKSENDRKFNGMINVGLGIFDIGIGLATPRQEEWGWFKYLGVAYILVGAANYLFPAGIENDYANIQMTNKDTEEGQRQREILSGKALKNESEEQARKKIIGSALIAALGCVYLSAGQTDTLNQGVYNISGITFLGLSAYTYFFTKSDAEKEYEDFLRERKER